MVPRRLGLVLAALGIIIAGCSAPTGRSGPRPEEGALGGLGLSDLPLSFIENRGQADPRVSYYLHGSNASVYFTPQGLTFSLGGERERWTARLDFVGARTVEPSGADPMPGIVSYFRGDPEEWRTGIPTYSRVLYRDLWPGIDLEYAGGARRLKYSFRLEPGADPADIRLSYRGADVGLNGVGELEVSTPVRRLVDERPVSSQILAGRPVSVPTSFELHGSTYGFRVGPYDHGERLTIDPAVLLYAGYIGGDQFDESRAIAIDEIGAAYIGGTASSDQTTFPETVGPDLTHNGGPDAFIGKVNPAGTALVYAGYIGGALTETTYGVDVDAQGAAYITGRTASDEATFPEVVGPDLGYNGGATDTFIAKVNPAGTGLVYAGYIGGSDLEEGNDVEVDASGAAYVTGWTRSDENTFPEVVGPDLMYNGNTDAFVAKVAPSGAALAYAGYIGGSNFDEGSGVALDASGAAYVSGPTASDELTFPEAVGPDLTHNGNTDALVAKVNPSGTALEYAGYIGGANAEDSRGITVDPSGAAYVVGDTRSDQTTFPVLVGPDTTFNGPTTERNAFVAKVNPGGSGLVWAGYIGGDDDDAGRSIGVDPTGAAYVTGRTNSDEASFPVLVAPDLTHNGGTDAFVAKVNPSGSALIYAGYIGGDQFDKGYGLVVDRGGNVFIAGRTNSDEITFPETVGPDLSYNMLGDAFAAKIGTTESCKGQPVTILGSEGDDQILGTADPDVVLALGGDDVVRTIDEADLVCAGGGKDTVRAGGGDGDRSFGEGGSDLLLGQGGKDTAKGGPGKDVVKGGSGRDRVAGQGGNDDVRGQGGPDRLNGGPGEDDCNGGAGTDQAAGCEEESNIP